MGVQCLFLFFCLVVQELDSKLKLGALVIIVAVRHELLTLALDKSNNCQPLGRGRNKSKIPCARAVSVLQSCTSDDMPSSLQSVCSADPVASVRSRIPSARVFPPPLASVKEEGNIGRK